MIRGIIQIKDDDISYCLFFPESAKLPAVQSAVGETWGKIDFFLLFCLLLASRSFFERKSSECILLTAGLTWQLWGDGSTLPKTSGNQRGNN